MWSDDICAVLHCGCSRDAGSGHTARRRRLAARCNLIGQVPVAASPRSAALRGTAWLVLLVSLAGLRTWCATHCASHLLHLLRAPIRRERAASCSTICDLHAPSRFPGVGRPSLPCRCLCAVSPFLCAVPQRAPRDRRQLAGRSHTRAFFTGPFFARQLSASASLRPVY